MSGFEMNEWINAAPNIVFAALTNPQNAPAINPGIKEMKKTTAGPIQKGSQFLETRLIDGKEARTELLVIEYEAPLKYAVSAVQSGITVLYTYSLKPENDGTQIRLDCDISSGGLKMMMLPLVASIMKREDGEHLTQLKTFVEKQALEA